MPKRINTYRSQNATICFAKVISEPEVYQWTDSNNDIKKSKTVFKMKSLTSGKEIDCIIWNNFSCKLGDEIRVKGRLEKDNKAFIVWNNRESNKSMALITKRAEQTFLDGGNNEEI